MHTVIRYFIGIIFFTILAVNLRAKGDRIDLGYANDFPAGLESESGGDLKIRNNVDTEIIYAGDMVVRDKGFSIFIERLPVVFSPYKYRANLIFKMSSSLSSVNLGVNCRPLSLSDSNGIVQVSTTLINLERENLVVGLVSPLKSIVSGQLNMPDSTYLSDGNVLDELKNKIRDQFANFERSQVQLSAAPIAGVFKVSDSAEVKLYKLKSEMDRYDKEVEIEKKLKDSNKTRGEVKKEIREEKKDKVSKEFKAKNDFTLDSVQIEIEDGNILNLHAYGLMDGKATAFYNLGVIGISNRNNLGRWARHRLYTRRYFEDLTYRIYSTRLVNIIDFSPMLASKSDDWSPADGVYTFKPNSAKVLRTVYKAPTSKILQARIFTDIVGVDNDRPNGLIQLEVDKKLIINNIEWGSNLIYRVGLLNYIKPSFTLNKIEEKQKYFVLQTFNQEEPEVDPIDLVSHINSSIGLEASVLHVSAPIMRAVIYGGYEGRINRVSFIDSNLVYIDSANAYFRTNRFNSSVLSHGPFVRAVFRPDTRYGLSIKYSWLKFLALSDEVKIQSIETSESGHAFSYEILAWANVSENGSFFIRPQLTHLHGRYKSTKSFFQFQFGYQFDIFSNNRTKPKFKDIMPASGG